MTPEPFFDAWGAYLSLFLAPFVQEDAAVIGAATAATMGVGEPALVFASVVAGLTVSDTWKYWAGRLAHTQGWARRFVEKPGVSAARDRVLKRLGLTMLVARFVPGTRIPLYVAAGLFGAPFWKFFPIVISTGMLYVGLMFAAFHWLGRIAGEQMHRVLPFAAAGIVAVALIAMLLRRRSAA